MNVPIIFLETHTLVGPRKSPRIPRQNTALLLTQTAPCLSCTKKPDFFLLQNKRVLLSNRPGHTRTWHASFRRGQNGGPPVCVQLCGHAFSPRPPTELSHPRTPASTRGVHTPVRGWSEVSFPNKLTPFISPNKATQPVSSGFQCSLFPLHLKHQKTFLNPASPPSPAQPC